MTQHAIIEHALSLPADEREEVLNAILLSLSVEVDPEIEKAIAEEMERRIDAVEIGEMETMSETEFFAHFETKQDCSSS